MFLSTKGPGGELGLWADSSQGIGKDWLKDIGTDIGIDIRTGEGANGVYQLFEGIFLSLP